ncbi:MAG: DUF1810 domain-containing protein [Verrucomicrobiaceae bacterium]
MFDLDRFVKAQDPVIQTVLQELRAGYKQTHWMWFVFPQLRGLGHSPTAQRYGIDDLAEARAYLEHAVLGARLQESVEVVLAVRGRTLHDIFGSPDDIKFRSSMTLFAIAGGDGKLFQRSLDRYCGGQMDWATIDLLKSS